MEAIQAATLNPEKYLGKQNELGTIEVGKLADLVLLTANPLDDISNTQKIEAMVVNGRYLGRRDLDAMLSGVERIGSSLVTASRHIGFLLLLWEVASVGPLISDFQSKPFWFNELSVSCRVHFRFSPSFWRNTAWSRDRTSADSVTGSVSQ
jgi:hypothetical protein